MAQPLAACLAVLLALQASAQTTAKNPRELKAELTRGFAKGIDLSGLDGSGQAEPLVQLLDQAKYVQAGREPGDAKETHIAFVRSVARRLGARLDPAVELYGNRVRPARAAAAAQREIDARAAIAEDVKRNPGISAEKKARLARNLSQTDEYLKMGMNGDANFVGGPKAGPAELNVTVVGAPARDSVLYDSHGDRNWSKILPQVQPVSLVTHPTPAPATTPGALSSLPSAMTRIVYSLTELSSFIDVKRGAEVAYEAVRGVLEEGRMAVHRCYAFVKKALIDAGVIDAPNPQSTAVVGLRPDQASMFNQDVQRHPEILNKLGYRRAKMSGLSNDPSEIPSGTIFIYGAQCAFAKYKSAGHAELSVSRAEYEKARAE
ncbi:MAG: hypothetical protein PHS14_07100, partial [Elusimicrobia bacterium]|nr:hypothetical protein [Elusimicrobiota bacterium]